MTRAEQGAVSTDLAELAQLTAAERVARQRVELMRRELITIARVLFLERGYDAVTVEELAAHAGISVRTFYRFFRFKIDVLVAVFDDFTEAFASEVERRPPSESSFAAIRAVIEDKQDEAIEAEFTIWAAIATASEAIGDAAKAALHNQNLARLTQAIARRMGLPPEQDLRPELLASSYLGAIRVAMESWTDDKGGRADWCLAALDTLAATLRDELS